MTRHLIQVPTNSRIPTTSIVASVYRKWWLKTRWQSGRYYYGLGNMYGATKRDYFGRSNFGNIVVKFTYLFDIIRTKNSNIK